MAKFDKNKIEEGYKAYAGDWLSDVIVGLGGVSSYGNNSVTIEFETWERASVFKKFAFDKPLDRYKGQRVILKGKRYMNKPLCLNELEIFEAKLEFREAGEKKCGCGRCGGFSNRKLSPQEVQEDDEMIARWRSGWFNDSNRMGT